MKYLFTYGIICICWEEDWLQFIGSESHVSRRMLTSTPKAQRNITIPSFTRMLECSQKCVSPATGEMQQEGWGIVQCPSFSQKATHMTKSNEGRGTWRLLKNEGRKLEKIN